MTDWENSRKILYPLGVTLEKDGAVIMAQAEGTNAALLLYEAGGKTPCERIPFLQENRMGDVWFLRLENRDIRDMEYQIEVDGRVIKDPFARKISGRETWGDGSREEGQVRACFPAERFQWGDDKNPRIPYSDTVLYRLHVRGFTMHPSSGVKHPGTFSGVAEKIPYLKALGVTSVELMPVTEFDEILRNDEKADGKIGAAGMTSGESQRLGAAGNAFRLNYWGYGPSYLYAVKAAYGSGDGISPEAELKTLVKKLHQEGMECIVELYLTGKEAPDQVLEVLRYWVLEYHVDGFHLSGFPPLLLAGESPFLSEIKLLADNWNELLSRRPAVGYLAPKTGKASVREKHLAEYGPSFQENMRRVLKGDEGMVQALAWHIRRNPADHAVINYMANTNGFTMADMVSYDRKHNENNGEENRDGSDYNYSWNCGEEGATKKKKIKKLRWQQLKNAYLLLFLSQGTPLLLAGDEFGNSQEGNNNAYCQDNEISWLDWRLAETNRQQLEFVRSLIAFRKSHPVFHMDREPRIMDYRSCGRPDLSYHGENAWKPEYEAFRRQLGVLYWGPYQLKEDQTEDDTFYVIFNMHWEPHMFGLPRLPQGQEWRIVCDSAKETADGAFSKENELPLKNQLHTAAAPRSILILRAEKKEPNKKEPKKKEPKKEESEKKEPKKEA